MVKPVTLRQNLANVLPEEFMVQSTRSFPDPAYCRVLPRCNTLYDCLADDARLCPYAVASDFGFLCEHAERSEFISCRNILLDVKLVL